MFNASIEQLESQISYHQEQCNLAQLELDGIQAAKAFADNAVEHVKETIDNLEPKYLDVFKEHLLNLFSVGPGVLNRVDQQEVKEVPQELIEEKPQPEKTEKEFGPLSYYELTGTPDLRPDTFEDLAPNLTYSSSGRAYVGFNDRREAEEFLNNLSEPAMLGDQNTMNGFKYEVKFYCEREYVQELADSINSMSEDVEGVQTPNIEKIDGSLVYSHADSICYVAGKSKGRLDNYGSYLTRILDIGDKYTVSKEPSFFETKYELRIEGFNSFEDALHLQSFNLLKEYNDSKMRVLENYGEKQEREFILLLAVLQINWCLWKILILGILFILIVLTISTKFYRSLNTPAFLV